MKYKIKAYSDPNLKDDWESQYIGLPTADRNIIMSGNPVRLNKHFKTEKEANDYTVQYLKDNNTTDYEVIENR